NNSPMTGTTKPNQHSLEEVEALKEEIARLKQLAEDQKKTIGSLAKNLHLYELASDGATDGLWDWNLKTKEKFVSKPWKRMLGYEDDELPTVSGVWKRLLHPDDLERAHSTIHAPQSTSFATRSRENCDFIAN